MHYKIIFIFFVFWFFIRKVLSVSECVGVVSLSGVTAILPAFNEEVAIGSVVLQAKRYADRVIVVDDGSADRVEVTDMAGAEIVSRRQIERKGLALKMDWWRWICRHRRRLLSRDIRLAENTQFHPCGKDHFLAEPRGDC